LQQLYFLGGYDGFGGLRTTERRGEQEAMAGLAISRPVFGPIRGIGEIMTGAMGSGPGFLSGNVRSACAAAVSSAPKIRG
jgi:hypothetical protein